MTISTIGINTSASGNALTLSWMHTLSAGSDRVVVVCYGAEHAGATISSVTYGGYTMSLASSIETAAPGTKYVGGIWYILNANLAESGASTVRVISTGSATGLENNALCLELSGVTQNTPELVATNYSSVSTTITSTISPSSGAWAISCIGCGQAGAYAHSSPQVEVLDFADSSSQFAVAELQNANGQSTLSSTWSGTSFNRQVRIVASFLASTSTSQVNAIISFINNLNNSISKTILGIHNNKYQINSIVSSLQHIWNSITSDYSDNLNKFSIRNSIDRLITHLFSNTNISAYVTKAFTSLNNSLHDISNKYTSIYNIKNNITKTLRFIHIPKSNLNILFNSKNTIKQNIGNTLKSINNLKTNIITKITPLYNNLKQINITNTSKFTIKKLTTKSISSLYILKGYASKLFTPLWNNRLFVISKISTLYRVLLSRTKTISLLFTNRSYITSIKNLIHTMGSFVFAISDYTSNLAQFIVTDYVNTTKSIMDSIRINITKASKFISSIRTNITKQRAILFNIKTNIILLKSSLYNIKSNRLNTILLKHSLMSYRNTTFSILHKMRSYTLKSLNILYSIKQTIFNKLIFYALTKSLSNITKAIGYNIKSLRTKSIITSNNIRNNISKSISSVYTSLKTITYKLTTLYNNLNIKVKLISLNHLILKTVFTNIKSLFSISSTVGRIKSIVSSYTIRSYTNSILQSLNNNRINVSSTIRTLFNSIQVLSNRIIISSTIISRINRSFITLYNQLHTIHITSTLTYGIKTNIRKSIVFSHGFFYAYKKEIRTILIRAIPESTLIINRLYYLNRTTLITYIKKRIRRRNP
jgi:hypothetical protein